MNPLNERVLAIQPSGIRKFMQLAEKVENSIGLTIGQPSFPTPEKIKEAAIQAINENRTSYTPNAGVLPLREEIANWVRNQYNLHYEREEVIVTVGASQALDIAIRTLFSTNDTVLLPCPAYPGYEPLLRLQGINVQYLDTSETGFKVTPALLERKWNSSIKGIILSYPNNPTGVTYSQEELRQLAQFLQNKPCYIIADEIYSEITYFEQHYSIANFVGMKEKTVVINGLSKSHAMTGWRVGFTLAPESITKEMIKVVQYNVSCATSISQYAAITALSECQADVELMREEYLTRKNYICSRLKEMNIDFVEPKGAFYIFPSIKKFQMSSIDFAVKLLETEKLAVTPGDAFSDYGEGYIRLSYAYSLEELKEACQRLERFILSL